MISFLDSRQGQHEPPGMTAQQPNAFSWKKVSQEIAEAFIMGLSQWLLKPLKVDRELYNVWTGWVPLNPLVTVIKVRMGQPDTVCLPMWCSSMGYEVSSLESKPNLNRSEPQPHHKFTGTTGGKGPCHITLRGYSVRNSAGQMAHFLQQRHWIKKTNDKEQFENPKRFQRHTNDKQRADYV